VLAAAVMTCPQVLMWAAGLVLLAWPRGGEARVRLNSILFLLLLCTNSCLPVLLQLYQCMSDLECSEGSYCHTSTKGPAHSRCHTCRRRKRRCHRDSMCCPGNHCSNNICVPDMVSFESQRILDSDRGMGPQSKLKHLRKRKRMDVKASSTRGQVGDPCLRSSDCSAGLCCARHFWNRICKPVLREGQVCTRHRRKGNHGLELFQRCPCGDGLSCQTLREPSTKPSSSSSSSLLIIHVCSNSLQQASRVHTYLIACCYF
uniref:Uncharacterized protein n=1 Tax=Anabas testudineus TaxID=64144 RepID=A0A3Q1JJJ3_ANATE